MHDSILTAFDNDLILRAEMAVKLITGSTGHGAKSEVQNPDRTDFIGNIRNTPLMSASGWLHLDAELNRKDEIRNNEDFQDGNFSALGPNYDRRAHAHHMVTRYNAPQLCSQIFHRLKSNSKKTHCHNNLLNRKT